MIILIRAFRGGYLQQVQLALHLRVVGPIHLHRITDEQTGVPRLDKTVHPHPRLDVDMQEDIAVLRVKRRQQEIQLPHVVVRHDQIGLFIRQLSH